jgi:16S rRNA (cytosine967-C5)-methyltransferase
LQRSFISNAISCLNPGGLLIYCVCSLERGEGEEQLDWIAKAHPELSLDPIAPSQLAGLEGAVTEAGAVRTHPGLAVPGDKPGMLDGFFVARFRRR